MRKVAHPSTDRVNHIVQYDGTITVEGVEGRGEIKSPTSIGLRPMISDHALKDIVVIHDVQQKSIKGISLVGEKRPLERLGDDFTQRLKSA